MRENLLPDNFECRQQDMALAFIDELYERGPMIGLLTGPAGCGKTHVLQRYQKESWDRHRARLRRRRVITREDALRRFRAAGFRTADDAAWFEEHWRREQDGRVSESELLSMIRERSEERGIELPEHLKVKKLEDRPCPQPAFMTPSQATTASGMIKLMARAVLNLRGPIWSCEDARNQLLVHLRRNQETLLIVDEAQRLKPEVLNIVREPYDDGGVSVLLVGTLDLEGKLMQRGAESLLSRVAIRERMEPLDAGQIHELLTGWDPRLVRRIYAHTAGHFRRIVKLVTLAEQIRQLNSEGRITDEILNEAVSMIPDLLPDTSRMRGTTTTKSALPGRGGTPSQPTAAEAPAVARRAAG
jgi:type II secretory pathway predicted ATPase ExeA